MRKFLKIWFPILLISSLLIVETVTTNANSTISGLNSGPTYEFTVGWNYGLNAPNSLWGEISSILSTKNLTINAEQMYSELNSLPKIFNFKAIVGNFSQGLLGDAFNTTLQMKLVNETNYMDFNPFLSHLRNICNNITNGSNFFDNITENLQNIFWSSYDNDSWFQLCNNGSSMVHYLYSNESSMFNNGFSLFVPIDFNFKTELNSSSIQNGLNSSCYWQFFHLSGIIPTSINNFNALLAAMGVTTFDVQNKSVLVKYNFADMDQNWLNTLINSSKSLPNFTDFNSIFDTLTQQFLWDPFLLSGIFGPSILSWLWRPFNDAIDLDQFLQSLCSKLNIPITTPKITAAVDLTYNNSGILQNAHSEYNLATTINGTSVNFNPQVDILSGMHNSIDANWNPNTVPGYPIWSIGLASLGGMTVVAVILTIKKKKSVKFDQLY